MLSNQKARRARRRSYAVRVAQQRAAREDYELFTSLLRKREPLSFDHLESQQVGTMAEVIWNQASREARHAGKPWSNTQRVAQFATSAAVT